MLRPVKNSRTDGTGEMDLLKFLRVKWSLGREYLAVCMTEGNVQTHSLSLCDSLYHVCSF